MEGNEGLQAFRDRWKRELVEGQGPGKRESAAPEPGSSSSGVATGSATHKQLGNACSNPGIQTLSKISLLGHDNSLQREPGLSTQPVTVSTTHNSSPIFIPKSSSASNSPKLAKSNITAVHRPSETDDKTKIHQCADHEQSSSNQTAQQKSGLKLGTVNFWWDKPKRTLEPFRIAENLLKGKPAQESFSKESSNHPEALNINNDEGFHFVKNKRLKLSGELQSTALKSNRSTEADNFLDLFLQDLEEINEIPFFDMQLSREVGINIFKHLDALDLCSCAQVSRAWRSLAEDELLWCTISHRLGYDKNTATVERQKWKDVVKRNVEKERQLQNNWKTRTGCLLQYQHVPGGVLCAADWQNHVIAGGYSNGDVRLWDVDQDESWTLNPSSTALRIDEQREFGTTMNQVSGLALSADYAAASYTQGNVDIWRLAGDTTPVHSFHCPQPITLIRSSPRDPLFAVAYGNHVRVEGCGQRDAKDFSQRGSITVADVTKVTDMQLVPAPGKSGHVVVLAANDKALIHRVGEDPCHMTTVHHALGQNVTCLDASVTQVAIATDAQDSFKVKLCCLSTGRDMSVLEGNTWRITALDLQHSPPFSVVTGSADRKLRIYDTRLPLPVLTFRGHGAAISRVQMDDWKVASGSTEGLVCVWDQRMNVKLWEMHNRHPVDYLHFHEERLVMAHIPVDKIPETDAVDSMLHRRHRGALLMYDFRERGLSENVPSNALSTYDEPEGYSYGIRLAMLYNRIT